MNAERAAAITPSSEQLVSGVTSHSSFGVPLVSIEWQSQSSSIRSQLVRNAMQFPCNSHAISIPFPCHFHIISMRTGGIGIDVKRHGLQSGSEMRNGTDMGQCRKRNSRVRSESEVRLEVGWFSRDQRLGGNAPTLRAPAPNRFGNFDGFIHLFIKRWHQV